MKKIIFFMVLATNFIPFLLTAQAKQETRSWFIEAGPYVGIAAWTLGVSRSVGIGADARIAREIGNNFSGGGKITYAYFLGKKIGNAKVKGISLAGIYANLQYTHEGKYVVGGDIGVGYSSSDGNSSAGFARTGYLGYQWNQQDRILTIAAYLNRTTLATYNIGIKSWLRF